MEAIHFHYCICFRYRYQDSCGEHRALWIRIRPLPKKLYINAIPLITLKLRITTSQKLTGISSIVPVHSAVERSATTIRFFVGDNFSHSFFANVPDKKLGVAPKFKNPNTSSEYTDNETVGGNLMEPCAAHLHC